MRSLVFVTLVVFAASVGCGVQGSAGPPRVAPPAEETDMAGGADGGVIGPPLGPRKREAAPIASGTRLKVQRVAGEDGSAQVGSKFWDVMLNLECSFEEVEDGQRCLPTALRTPDFYTDDRCGMPLFILPACSAPVTWISAVRPNFGTPPNFGACRGALYVYRVKALRWQEAPTVAYVFDGLTCTQARVPQSLYLRYLVPDGTPLAITEFARGTTSIDQ